MSKTPKKQPAWLIGGVLVVAGFLIARLLGRAIGAAEPGDIDDNAPQKLELHFDERRYPPFYDGDAGGVRIEGEYNEAGDKQLVIIGIDQKELDEAMRQPDCKFAVARSDSSGLWYPAIAEKGLWYGKATDRHGEVYAFSAFVGPSILHLLPGVSADGHFTPYKSTRILALTNQEGLLYDYPNVPVIYFRGKGEA